MKLILIGVVVVAWGVSVNSTTMKLIGLTLLLIGLAEDD